MITKQRINKFICIGVLFFYLPIYSQNNIEISIEMITICTDHHWGYHWQNKSFAKSINFAFNVKNKNKENILLGTNTYHYRIDKENLNKGVFGRVFIINNNDTIPLLTNDYANLLPLESDDFTFVGSIDYIVTPFKEVTEKFFMNVPSKEKKSLKYLYKYFKESKFIYVPIEEDYEYLLHKQKKVYNQKPVYPKEIINITPLDPYVLIYGNCENETRVKFYPPKKH